MARKTTSGGSNNKRQIRVGVGGTYVRGNSTLERMATVRRHSDATSRAVRASRGSDVAAFDRGQQLHQAFLDVARQGDRRRNDARRDANRSPTRGGGPTYRGRPSRSR